VIDATTGVIDLGASAPNTYDITYSFGTAPCTGTATSQVTIGTPTLTITDPSTVCAPNTIDLTAPAVTVGSDAGLNYTYWTDASATTVLANPNAVATVVLIISGQYRQLVVQS
jgi:hypothetical protein